MLKNAIKQQYEKNELGFALIWIGLYVIVFSIADNLSQMLGMEKVITAPLCIVFAAVLFLWVKKSGLLRKYGLCKISGNPKSNLYFLPFFTLATCNFWNGLTLNVSPLESILYIISMLCVGFIEELIFRGFLFRALSKDSIKSAIVISSITFGFGHIVNLLNGADFLSTMLQIVYAVAIGFAFTVFFYKSGSILPCIITHSFVNATSIFAVEGSAETQVFSAIVITLAAAFYGIYLMRYHNKQ